MTRTAPTLQEIESGRIAAKQKDREFWAENKITEKIKEAIDKALEGHDFVNESQCFGNTAPLCSGYLPRGWMDEMNKIVEHYTSYGYRCHLELSGNNSIYYKLTPESISHKILGLK